MPLVEFNESDLKRNMIVTPAWYRLSIESMGEWKESKNKTSNNLECEALIIKNADDGSEEFTGVPVTIRFNDSPKMKPVMETFLVSIMGEKIEATRYEMNAAIGKEVEAFVGNTTYEGRVRNEVQLKFRPVRENRGV